MGDETPVASTTLDVASKVHLFAFPTRNHVSNATGATRNSAFPKIIGRRSSVCIVLGGTRFQYIKELTLVDQEDITREKQLTTRRLLLESQMNYSSGAASQLGLADSCEVECDKQASSCLLAII